MPKECPSCRTVSDDHLKFCGSCGHTLQAIDNKPPKNQTGQIAGAIAAVLGTAGLLMPYFAAVLLVPLAFVAAVVALAKGSKLLGFCGIGLGVLGLVGIVSVSNQISSSLTPFTQRSASPTDTQRITSADYARISEGMSYAQVVAIVGSGEESSRTEIGGYTTVMYSWKNPNGSNMNAMFQNDKLVTKAQFGLN